MNSQIVHSNLARQIVFCLEKRTRPGPSLGNRFEPDAEWSVIRPHPTITLYRDAGDHLHRRNPNCSIITLASNITAFLGRLLRTSARKVFLIVDWLRAREKATVMDWVEAHKDRIELFPMPPYNPDEYLNNDLKGNVHEAVLPGNKEELRSGAAIHAAAVLCVGACHGLLSAALCTVRGRHMIYENLIRRSNIRPSTPPNRSAPQPSDAPSSGSEAGLRCP